MYCGGAIIAMNKIIQEGFTMMELMIVIAIIGILAAVAIPVYQDYIGRAQMAEALSLASGQKAVVSEFYGFNSSCPDNVNSASKKGGLADASKISGKYVEKVEVGVSTGTVDIGGTSINGECEIKATMRRTGVNGDIAGKYLILRMAVTSGSYQWGCVSDAAEKFLPTTCQ